MSRALAEWIGKTDDTPVPPRVRLRIFDAYKGICQCGCGQAIAGKPWARLVTAWGIVVGRWSIERAWQEGYAQHIRDEKFNRVFHPTGPVYETAPERD